MDIVVSGFEAANDSLNVWFFHRETQQRTRLVLGEPVLGEDALPSKQIQLWRCGVVIEILARTLRCLKHSKTRLMAKTKGISNNEHTYTHYITGAIMK